MQLLDTCARKGARQQNRGYSGRPHPPPGVTRARAPRARVHCAPNPRSAASTALSTARRAPAQPPPLHYPLSPLPAPRTQVMAIATLAKLANNGDVFTGVVKIRKGQALYLLQNAGSMRCVARVLARLVGRGRRGRGIGTRAHLLHPILPHTPHAHAHSTHRSNVHLAFLHHSRAIAAAIPRHHKAASSLATAAAAEIEAACLAGLPRTQLASCSPLLSPLAVLLVVVALAAQLRHLYARSLDGAWGDGGVAYLPRITDSWDVAALAGVVACIAALFGGAGVPFVAAAIAAPASPLAGAAPEGSGKASAHVSAGEAAAARATEAAAAHRAAAAAPAAGTTRRRRGSRAAT